MKKTLLVITILLTISMTVYAQKEQTPPQWEKVKVDESGNTFYYDINNVKEVDGQVYIWGLVELGEPSKALHKEQTGKDAKSNKMHMVIDCNNKAFGNIEYVTYGPDDQIIDEYKYPSGDNMDWKNIEKRNPVAKIYKKVCK